MGTALRSSLREVDPEVTLERVAPLAASLGIARVTDVTCLDRFGIPVCVGVRPDAQPGSLCVTAGKGIRRIDARIGALMEAVEMAWAEYGRSKHHVVPASARILGGLGELVTFAPRKGTRLELDAPLPTVVAEDVATGERVLVPAELVFHPFRVSPVWFGTTTNGLASGNTADEATLHALFEVIERDALAFIAAGSGASRVVAPDSLPEEARVHLAALAARDLDVIVRHVPSDVGIAVVSVMTSDAHDRTFAMRGDGCHLVPEIALTRAFTEAMQSRLSYIHGGRDDLIDMWRTGERGVQTGEAELRGFAAGEVVEFAAVPRLAATTVTEALRLVRAHLAAAGFSRVLRVVLTPTNYPVAVVRVIVPGLEQYSGSSPRMGPRLRRMYPPP